MEQITATIGSITVPASGIRNPAGIQMNVDSGMIRPSPTQAVARVTTSAPSRPPIAPMPKPTPSCASSSPRRSAKSTSIAPEIELNRLASDVRRRDPPEQRVLEHEGEPFAHLHDERSAALARGRGVDVLDPAYPERRPDEAQGVERDGERCADQLDQPAGSGRAADHRDRLHGLELGVALADVLGLDDVGQVALVGDVEEDRAAAHHQCDHQHLREGEHVEGPGEGERGEREAADQVVGHQHPLLAPPVDPGARRQPDDEEGEELAGREQAHLERARVEHLHGEDGDGQHGELRAELAQRVAEEQLAEVVVAEQPAAQLRGGSGSGRSP